MIIEKMERRFGGYAVAGLIRYIVLFNGLVYVLQLLVPGFDQFLLLRPDLVMSGQVWRLFTWVFLPETMSPIWILFALLFLWFLGDLLEESWGSFRVNLFYLSGWFFTTVAGMLLPGSGLGAGANVFLNLSILFAAATMQPAYQVMLFFVIPLQLKWLAILSAVLLGLSALGMPLESKAAVLLSFANYFLFFGPEFVRGKREQGRQSARREKFLSGLAEVESLHRCSVCGRTEVSDPDLEFRVRADGTEFCLEHLAGKGMKDEG